MTMNDTLLAAVAAFVAIAGIIAVRAIPSRRHRRKRREAARILDRLQEIDNRSPLWVQNYLRKIDPYTFEETILEALERKGHKVRRNRSYSGDGGVDGRARIDGRWHAIQAKRYSGYVDAADVRDFARKCGKMRCPGLFVTTGEVGKGAEKEAAAGRQKITIINGEQLKELFINNTE